MQTPLPEDNSGLDSPTKVFRRQSTTPMNLLNSEVYSNGQLNDLKSPLEVQSANSEQYDDNSSIKKASKGF